MSEIDQKIHLLGVPCSKNHFKEFNKNILKYSN